MRNWSDEEISYLRENLNKMNNKELAKALSRTSGSVMSKLYHLDLTRTEEFRKHIWRAEMISLNQDRYGENNPNWKGGISKDNYHYKKLQMVRYPERVEARDLVNRAVREGKLKRANCSVCDAANAHAHHEDYSKPFEIIWLCRRCHRKLHEDA